MFQLLQGGLLARLHRVDLLGLRYAPDLFRVYGIVFDDQYGLGHGTAPLDARSPATGRR